MGFLDIRQVLENKKNGNISDQKLRLKEK